MFVNNVFLLCFQSQLSAKGRKLSIWLSVPWIMAWLRGEIFMEQKFRYLNQASQCKLRLCDEWSRGNSNPGRGTARNLGPTWVSVQIFTSTFFRQGRVSSGVFALALWPATHHRSFPAEAWCLQADNSATCWARRRETFEWHFSDALEDRIGDRCFKQTNGNRCRLVELVDTSLKND